MSRRKSSTASVHPNKSNYHDNQLNNKTTEFASKFNKVNGKAMIDALKESRRVNPVNVTYKNGLIFN